MNVMNTFPGYFHESKSLTCFKNIPWSIFFFSLSKGCARMDDTKNEWKCDWILWAKFVKRNKTGWRKCSKLWEFVTCKLCGVMACIQVVCAGFGDIDLISRSWEGRGLLCSKLWENLILSRSVLWNPCLKTTIKMEQKWS